MSTLTPAEVFSTPTGPSTSSARTSAAMRQHLQESANRTEWTEKRLRDVIGVPIAITNVDASTNVITTGTHGLSNADPIRFTSVGGSIPAGLAAGTIYYARDVTATTFKVAATPGGSAIDITGTGSGTLYVWTVPDASLFLFILLATSNTWAQGQIFSDGIQVAGAGVTTNTALVEGLLTAARTVLGEYDAGTITGTGDVTIDVATAKVFRAATPTGNRIVSVATSGVTAGERVQVVRPATGNFTYTLRTLGSGSDIAVMAALTHCDAELLYNGAAWTLIGYSTGVTPGAVA